MKFEMNDKSLFAVLLRSPWWMSTGIVLVVVVLSKLLLRPDWFIYGAFGAVPFAVIAGMTAWKQLQAPSAGRVTDTVAAVRGMSWVDLANALELGFQRDGYSVTRDTKVPVDFELVKGYRTTLVSAKRWKMARVGVEPLKELIVAKDAREAHETMYVTVGEITANARAYATQNKIRLVTDAELARLLPAAAAKGKPAAERA